MPANWVLRLAKVQKQLSYPAASAEDGTGVAVGGRGAADGLHSKNGQNKKKRILHSYTGMHRVNNKQYDNMSQNRISYWIDAAAVLGSPAGVADTAAGGVEDTGPDGVAYREATMVNAIY